MTIAALSRYTLLHLARPERVLHEHHVRYAADPAGHGRDGGCDFLDVVEVHVADGLGLGLALVVEHGVACGVQHLDAVYAYVYHYRAGLYHVLRHQARLAGGDYQYVRAYRMLLGVALLGRKYV